MATISDPVGMFGYACGRSILRDRLKRGHIGKLADVDSFDFTVSRIRLFLENYRSFLSWTILADESSVP